MLTNDVTNDLLTPIWTRNKPGQGDSRKADEILKRYDDIKS